MLPIDNQSRALASGGSSNSKALYRTIREGLAVRGVSGGTILDLGCGKGILRDFVGDRFDRYVGVDLISYGLNPYGEMAPADFVRADFDGQRLPIADETGDLVCSLETIEHLNHPRFFFREMVRLTRPGGWLIISTPNQLSLHSKACLVFKNEFAHFQERPGLYPAHVSALIEIDLVRMARECGLAEIEVTYSGEGRVPGTGKHWPPWLTSRTSWRGRAFSDTIFLWARRA